MARTLAKWIVCAAASLSGCAAAPRADTAAWVPPRVPTIDSTSAGVQMLEPYDSERIPVLFVHGIGGSPRDFDAIVGRLDRTRFQAWVMRYPTDAGLLEASRVMGRALAELQRKHRYRSLFVVAHSMGGLVSRRYLIDAVQESDGGVAHVLVTFSSPWNGNEWASVGARLVPNPPRPWIDLSPESAFLLSMRGPMRGVPHHVFFGYRRGPSLLTSESSDGAITLKSQIPDWIQQQAEHCWGFDADHTDILANDAALDRLNRLLAHAAEHARAGLRASGGPH
jgi:pimeloyl-ACP methyl ester carboxylesterase